MKLLVILALIAVASAIPGCAYFQNDQACFSSYAIDYCKTYGTLPWICGTCFPGFEPSATGRSCVPKETFYNWTLWPTTSAGDVTAQGDSQNCLNFHVQYALAQPRNAEGATPYAWDYENMSCVINGQQVCQTCKAGYRWDTKLFKCVACSSIAGCKTCSSVDNTAVTCSACLPEKFLSQNTCSDCGTGILTCTAKDIAVECKPSFFKDGTKCSPCASNVQTCKSLTEITTCNSNAFLDGTKCTLCDQTNTASCTALLVAGIKDCNLVSSVATETIYKVPGEGCISHADSKKCKTVGKSVSTYYCTACFEGYFRNGGDCVTLDSVCISSNDPTLTAAVACTVIADQSLLTSITPSSIPCKTGYFLDARTGTAANTNKCRKCASSAANCGEGTCQSNGTTNAPKCAVAPANGVLTAAAPEVVILCATFFDPGCLTCTLTNCLTVSDGYFLCQKKLGVGKSDDFSKKVSCNKDYVASAPSNTGNYSLDGLAAITDVTTLITNCKYYELDATIATQYKCTLCVRTSEPKVVITFVNTGLTTRTNAIQKCIKGGASGTLPVNEAKWEHCLQAIAEGELDTTTTKCKLCDTAKSLTAATEALGCTAIASLINGCTLYTDATHCNTCSATTIKITGGTLCVTKVAGCSTHVQPDATATAAVCEACQEGYAKKSTGANCYQCSLVSGYTLCAEYKINGTDDDCGCKTCIKGYYIASPTTTSLCVNTNDASKYCFMLSQTMTGTWACAVCNYSYKYVNGACLPCSTASTGCVYTGCASQPYINKATTPAAAATSYSSIISFLIMTLVALMTFMI